MVGLDRQQLTHNRNAGPGRGPGIDSHQPG